MTGETRIPQEAVDRARALDVAEIAARYGFAARASASGEAVGPCPGCGGTDRFSVNAKKNIWRCRQGGGDPIGGDAIALVQHVDRCGFGRAIEILTGEAATVAPRRDPAKAEAEQNEFREKERRRAYALLRGTVPFPDDGAVARYLAGRGLSPDLARMDGARCREHADLPFWHFCESRLGKQWRVIHRGPAMVWPITGLDGHFLGLHATWIDPDTFGKAEIFDPDTGEQLPAKKVRGSKKGGRIVLRLPAWRGCTTAAVGEGVESVLSWHAIADRDVALYSAADLGNLAGRAERTVAHPEKKIVRRDKRQMPVRVPGPTPKEGEDQSKLFAPDPGIDSLILLGDSDSDAFTTIAAMERARARLGSRGLDLSIDWPPDGHDFNSFLKERNSADA